MMKQWKEELKVSNEDEDSSAINGETEDVNGPVGEVQEGDGEGLLSIDELEVPKDSGSRRVSFSMGHSFFCRYLIMSFHENWRATLCFKSIPR